MKKNEGTQIATSLHVSEANASWRFAPLHGAKLRFIFWLIRENGANKRGLRSDAENGRRYVFRLLFRLLFPAAHPAARFYHAAGWAPFGLNGRRCPKKSAHAEAHLIFIDRTSAYASLLFAAGNGSATPTPRTLRGFGTGAAQNKPKRFD